MKDFNINIFLVNKTKFYEGKEIGDWIRLPNPNLEQDVANILGEDKELAIHDAECDFLDVDENDDVFELNKLAFEIKNLKAHKKTILSCLLELNYDIRDIINIVENEGCIFYCDVSNYEELGEYLIENNYLKVPIEFEKYIDKEKLATDYTKNKNIYFCKSGHAIEIL